MSLISSQKTAVCTCQSVRYNLPISDKKRQGKKVEGLPEKGAFF